MVPLVDPSFNVLLSLAGPAKLGPLSGFAAAALSRRSVFVRARSGV